MPNNTKPLRFHEFFFMILDFCNFSREIKVDKGELRLAVMVQVSKQNWTKLKNSTKLKKIDKIEHSTIAFSRIFV